MNNILKMQNISLSYYTEKEEIEAISNVNLTVEEGEFIAFVGPSGCGKTTLLSIINGLLSPTNGEVYIDGNIVKGINNKTGYMLQRDCLFPWRTIWQNIVLPLEIKKELQEDKRIFLEELLTKYGLYDFKNRYPNQLSGGMRQRVALIRTLALNPSILLLDEPFSALDYQTRLKVCDDVYSIISEHNKTAILVTHDIAEAISMADKIYILSARPGKIKKVINVNLKENETPFKRREHPDFRIIFDTIWKEMQENG